VTSSRLLLDLVWLIILLLALRHFWQKRQFLVDARSWLKVKGRINSCKWAQEERMVWPEIEYSYQVYNQELVGHYLFLDTTHNTPNSKYSRLVAYKAAVAYQEFAEIDVYYNPSHPEQSALDVTMPRKLTFILILIALLTGIHLAVIGARLWWG
jgi:hypothetical protein